MPTRAGHPSPPREREGADGPSQAGIRRFARIAGLAATGVGILVLTGWTLDVEALKGPIPGLITMKANTAVGFTLMGLALRSLAGSGSRVRWGLLPAIGAVIAFAVGAVSFAEYLLARDLGIDQLLVHDGGGGATVDPGRLAPQTAIVFMLLGAGLLMLRGESAVHRRLGQGLPLVAGTISLFALLGYAYGVRSFSTVGPFSPMAVHTAATSLVLSLGLLATRPHWLVVRMLSAPTAGGIMARRLTPAAIVGVPILGAIRLYGESSGLYGREMGVALFTISLVIVLTTVILLTARARDRADAGRRLAAMDQRRLATIVESSGDAILSKTPEGIITSWNSAAERLYGYRAEEILGHSINRLVPPEIPDDASNLLAEVLAGREVSEYETERVRSDGTRVAVSLRVSPMTDDEGRIFGASTIARDITDRKEVAKALEAAKDEAERANHAKSEFLSRMSHELRTPLNAILGFGQLLEMDELSDSQRGDVAQIVKGGRHLLDLINEVLEISTIEAGNMAMSLEAVQIGHLLDEAVDLIEPLAEERRLTLAVARDETCACYVQADNQRLKQVLLNLLSNAVKYNREQGRIDVSCAEMPDGRLRVAVTDTGPGIPAEHLARLFTPFERLGAEGTAAEGTGLGLALSKRLVEAMDGTLTVESEPGVGTTFTVELAQGEGSQAPLEEGHADNADGVLILGGSGASATVLYIEDNVSNYRLVEQILVKRPEIKLIAAMEGRLGIDLARQHLPDLVLLDLHLPGMSGDEVLAELRADARTTRMPIVVISADATEGQIKRLMAAGADGYLTKPIDVRRFLEVVEEHLGAGVEAVG